MGKSREYGPAPNNMPDIDIDSLIDISEWQRTTYRKPILDDITGYYGYFPSPNGLMTYVQRASKKNPAQHKDGELVEEYIERKKRQPLNIAETAELATALFWTSAFLRKEVLLEAVKNISDGREVQYDVSRYAADAVTDYGYSLENPVDIDYRGINHGKGLKQQIERVSPGASHNLLEFGKFIEANPEELHTFEAVASMELTITEQQRRIDYWKPRHEAILEIFPKIAVSEEILLQRVPLDEMLDIQLRIPDSV